MNQDFRVSVGFLSHRKTISLRRQLKEAGIVGLLGLWSHAAAHNWLGDYVGFTPDDIARAAGWRGRPTKFVDTLVECGFLDTLPEGGYRIHDWHQWNEYATQAEERVAKARRAAQIRHSKGDSNVAGGDAKSNASSTSFAARSLPPSTPEETTRYVRAGGGRI